MLGDFTAIRYNGCVNDYGLDQVTFDDYPSVFCTVCNRAYPLKANNDFRLLHRACPRCVLAGRKLNVPLSELSKFIRIVRLIKSMNFV